MRPARIALVTVIALAVTVASAAALSTKDRISFAGLGPVKLGMTERSVEHAAKRGLRLGSSPGLDCAAGTIAGKTIGLFTGGRLRRIYIRTPRFATKEGVRVGSSERRVLAAYRGRLIREPQKYAPDQDDLVLRSGARKIRFSLTNGTVTQISTGIKPEIDLVEGCS